MDAASVIALSVALIIILSGVEMEMAEMSFFFALNWARVSNEVVINNVKKNKSPRVCFLPLIETNVIKKGSFSKEPFNEYYFVS